MFVYSFFDWFKFICVIYIRQKGLQAFQSAPVKTLKFVGRPVSHKALSSAALLRGRPDGVVVNTSALESRGRGFKSRSGQFLGFSLCVCLERFSNECRKTKTKVIIPANHNKHKLSNEPIRTRSKYMLLASGAGKNVRARASHH